MLKVTEKSGNATERAVLIGLCAESMEQNERSDESSMEELSALLETAGGTPCATVLQNRKTPDPRSFIGAGKVSEIKAVIKAEGCALAVFDNELSPSQTRALSQDLGIRVIDRTVLILDIFAQRAATREGRLQVELAQLKYMLPRLTGMWTHLTSQTASGGSSPIGTRGPGETQLETDRRHVRRRIDKLEKELVEVRKTRTTQRRRREKHGVPVVALVGYTNAGKSTLLNTLTGADVHTADRLFDTLDTTTRRWRVTDTLEVLLSDTVGFIRKLPHHLVEAFKATLEELSYADLLLHVIDISASDWTDHAKIVGELITRLGAGETPCIEVFNKSDLFSGDILPRGENKVCISSVTGEGIEDLSRAIAGILDDRRRVTLLLPYMEAKLLELLHKEAGIEQTEFLDEGIRITAIVSAGVYGRIRGYITGVDGR